MKKPIDQIRNCVNCKQLEWVDAECESGYACDKQYRSEADESNHLARLEDADYLEAPKKCCVLINDGRIRTVRSA